MRLAETSGHAPFSPGLNIALTFYFNRFMLFLDRLAAIYRFPKPSLTKSVTEEVKILVPGIHDDGFILIYL